MTALVELVDRGLLSALAIAYGDAGVHDRAARLADAAAHVGRPLTTSAELSAEEARALRRHIRRCTPDSCRFTTAVRMSPAGDGTQTPPDGAGVEAPATTPAGTAPDPSGSGHGYAGPDAQPQVSPSRSRLGKKGGGLGASDAPAELPTADVPGAAAILCGPRGQQPTARDLAMVAAFAAQLAAARPARTVHRHDPGCSPGGGHLVPAGVGVRYCACRTVADVPPAPDRSCPPRICFCGACPWWRPGTPVNYAAAIAKLAEAGDRR